MSLKSIEEVLYNFKRKEMLKKQMIVLNSTIIG